MRQSLCRCVWVVLLMLGASASARDRHPRETGSPTYAGISYSPSTGQLGWARGFGNADAALAASSSSCGLEDCTPVIWTRAACAAVAQSELTTATYGWAWSTAVADAGAQAVDACNGQNNGACHLVQSVCT
jgi:serine/threonine-protein kinase